MIQQYSKPYLNFYIFQSIIIRVKVGQMKKEALSTKFAFVLGNQETMKNIDHLKIADYEKFKTTNQIGRSLQQYAKDNQWQLIQTLTEQHQFILPFLKLEIQDAFLSSLNLQNYETIKYFLENGFNISSVAEDALLTVCYSLEYLKKHQTPIELFKLVLQYGANPRIASDRNSDTPMHLAAKYNQIQFMKLLIEYGGDINGINDKRETPLGMAIKHKREEAIKFLKQKGAEDNWKK